MLKWRIRGVIFMVWGIISDEAASDLARGQNKLDYQY